MKKKNRNNSFRNRGEIVALEYLVSKGHRPLCNNYHTGYAEIDLITIDPNLKFHFTEVKSWTNPIIHPLESLTLRRREKIRTASLQFLADYSAMERYPVTGGSIREHNQPDCAKYGLDYAMSFNLIWIRENSQVEYFEGIF